MSGLQTQFLAALPRHSAAAASQRTIPAQRLSEALRWHQPQPAGATRAPLRRHGGTLVRRLSAPPCRRTGQSGVSTHSGNRRALLHAQAGLRHHLLRFAESQHLRRGGRAQRTGSGSLAGKTARQAAGESGVHGSGQRISLAGQKALPQARIVADRFHVIRIVNHHFLACWKELDPVGAKHRGLLSLMRRHRHNLKPEQHAKLSAYLQTNPLLELVYRFKQKLCYLLLEKGRNQSRCRKLAPRLLRMIAQLQDLPLPSMVQLGKTLHAWREEIATMWRFTRNNGITKGFHTKMELLQRQAYGFRNFNNYRLRVKVLCG